MNIQGVAIEVDGMDDVTGPRIQEVPESHRQMRLFKVSREMLKMDYVLAMANIISYIEVCLGCATEKDVRILDKLVKKSSSVVDEAGCLFLI